MLRLMETINEVRLGVWKNQPEAFFEAAIVDVDGTIAPTFGECKEGMDLSYNGQWSYHPLVLSLANTQESLYLVNRPGSRPSHEQAHEYMDRTIVLCRRAGFRTIWLRGDFFFITNEWEMSAEELVLFANDRCNQENLIDQLKNGVKAMRMPTGDLMSNWAYMVMASLAWTLKAWMALNLPISPRHREKHEAQKKALLRMEFKGFVNAIVRMPAQIVRTGRRIVYRLLSWNPWQAVLVRGVEAWRVAARC